MIVDANVLLSARNEADPRHQAARGWIEAALNGDERVGLPWQTLGAFLRIATNPRAFPLPLSPEDATRQVEEWLDAPRAWLAGPTDRFCAILTGVMRRHRVVGPLVPDAMLVALAIDHGVSLVSTDADFARFPEVRWIDPLAST